MAKMSPPSNSPACSSLVHHARGKEGPVRGMRSRGERPGGTVIARDVSLSDDSTALAETQLHGKIRYSLNKVLPQ